MRYEGKYNQITYKPFLKRFQTKFKGKGHAIRGHLSKEHSGKNQTTVIGKGTGKTSNISGPNLSLNYF
jgi:hypothetical protein